MNTQDPGLNPRPIVFGGLACAALAAVGMLIIGAVAGFEWWLSAIMAYHMAVAFAITGGWAIAVFVFDDASSSDSPVSQRADAHSHVGATPPEYSDTVDSRKVA